MRGSFKKGRESTMFFSTSTPSFSYLLEVYSRIPCIIVATTTITTSKFWLIQYIISFLFPSFSLSFFLLFGINKMRFIWYIHVLRFLVLFISLIAFICHISQCLLLNAYREKVRMFFLPIITLANTEHIDGYSRLADSWTLAGLYYH